MINNINPNDGQSLMLDDLAKSGLVPADLDARVIQNSERAVTSIPASIQGYIIPYRDIYGKLIPHYRVKVFNFADVRYKQPKESQNHVYFPPAFRTALTNKNYIMITEGEKKAVLACKLGFPCVALGGVDSWRNRILRLPADSELSQGKKSLIAKVPSKGGEVQEDYASPLATGMQELVDLLLYMKGHLIIVYDTDIGVGVKPQVQRAAAALAFELRFRGIPFNKLRQLILPPMDSGDDDDPEKVALDDYLVNEGPAKFDVILKHTLTRRSAFPRHPNIRDFINRRLQNPRLSRKEAQQVSMAILSDMDANGLRLESEEGGDAFYFDMNSHRLMKYRISSGSNEVNASGFGQYLYQQFGLASADHKLITWLGAQFLGEEPIDRVTPYRVFARPPLDDHRIYYQVSDGQYVTISHRNDTSLAGLPGLEVYDNGENGVLFEAEQVKPVDVKRMLIEYSNRVKEPLTPWWMDVLSQVRLRDQDKQRIVTMLLYYMSPWLYRWRGLQLPVEMVLGEPGSGKSTLFELRLNIISGDPRLRNAPSDLKDWHASIANSGGLHVTDNVQLVDKQLRQRLSDEICRIVTEPKPYIEMRRYYTEADLRRIPVKVVFALTALHQPFVNADILQRAVITDLDKPVNAMFDSNWAIMQLTRFGGREAWISHHLYVLHKFLERAQTRWDPSYQALHRLVHFEQTMMIMAEIFDIENSWIPSYLSGLINKSLTDADWAFEGLAAFCDSSRAAGHEGKYFTVQEVNNWAEGMPEYEKNEILINGRRLGKYLKAHKSMIGSICGMVESGTTANRTRYKLLPMAPKAE